MKFPLLLTCAVIIACALPACTPSQTQTSSRPTVAGAGRVQPHNPRSITPPRRGGHAIQNWTRNDVTGMTISLIDPKIRETYRFSGNGFVAATIGEKSGPLAGPLFYWRINHGVLEISDTENKTVEQLRLVNRTPQTITAINKQGKTVSFEVGPIPR